MSSRKGRKRKRRSSTPKSTSKSSGSNPTKLDSKPKFIETCKQLLNQITNLDDSKPFHKKLNPHDKLYNEYIKFNSEPISFKTIHQRLHQKPCHYANYDTFNEDIGKIFYQEKRLKNYKGNSDDIVKKRIQNAKRIENYWNTLTASYTQFGFDVINARNESDDHKEDVEGRKSKQKKESKKEKRQKKVLSNIKKRVKRGDESSQLEPPQKRRKIDPNIAQYKDDDDAKKEMDQNHNKNTPRIQIEGRLDKESPFTPFAVQSRVFNKVMGNTEDLFKNVAHLNGNIKRKLSFDDNNDAGYRRNPMRTFEIKWRYNDAFHSKEVKEFDIEATRMDCAVKQFKTLKSNAEIKILSVRLRNCTND